MCYMDCVEVIPESNGLKVKNNRYEALSISVGDEMVEKLHHLNLFMVGVGALGCELLKNFAMLGIASG